MSSEIDRNGVNERPSWKYLLTSGDQQNVQWCVVEMMESVRNVLEDIRYELRQLNSKQMLLHRLREACGGPKLTKLKGIVELDECFIGGKEGNKHEHKKLKAGRGSVGKIAVLGMRERGTGRTLAAPMHERSLQEATQRIHDNIELGTQLYTDEHLIFTGLDGLFYKHDAVNHSAGEYAAGPAHTNSIESVWAVLKRGYYGVYHSMSGKHLRRYVDEFTFRLNEGNVKRHSLERLDSMIEAVSGKRLTYAGLTA